MAMTGLFKPVSREGALLFNNLVLATAAAAVLLGTLYPLLLDALDGGKVSVGAPFFNATFVPLMIPVLIAAVIGSRLSWKRSDLAGVLSRLGAAVAIAVLVALVVAWFAAERKMFGAVGLGITAWLVVGSLVEMAERIALFRVPLGASLRRAAGLPRAAWGMALAHGALGIMVAGITATSAWQTEKIQAIKLGDSVEVAGYTLRFDSVGPIKGPNYDGQRGHFTVLKGDKVVTVLLSEKRRYPVENNTTTEAGILWTPLGDLYAVLGDRAGPKGWTTRFYFNPLVSWIWFGAVLMALGGLISLTDRRHRVGAPKRAARAVAAAAPARAGA